MEPTFDLTRFHRAQERTYSTALSEIHAGRKQSHWMWFIFPQLRGLGQSEISMFYGINGFEEARAYWEDDVLRERLLEICEALLALNTDDPRRVMGSPDDMKLKSCITLFRLVDPDCAVLQQVLNKYFCGREDRYTLRMLGL